MPPPTTSTSAPAARPAANRRRTAPGPRPSSPVAGHSARVAAPAARIVCRNRPSSPGQPLTEMAASPAPNAYSIANWPGSGSAMGSSYGDEVERDRVGRLDDDGPRPGSAPAPSVPVRPGGVREVDVSAGIGRSVESRRRIRVAWQALGRPAGRTAASAGSRTPGRRRTSCPQARAIDGDDPRRLEGPDVARPPIGREDPRPADHLARPERLDDQRVQSARAAPGRRARPERRRTGRPARPPGRPRRRPRTPRCARSRPGSRGRPGRGRAAAAAGRGDRAMDVVFTAPTSPEMAATSAVRSIAGRAPRDAAPAAHAARHRRTGPTTSRACA